MSRRDDEGLDASRCARRVGASEALAERLVDVDEVAAAGVVAGLPAHSVVRLDLDAGRAGPE